MGQLAEIRLTTILHYNWCNLVRAKRPPVDRHATVAGGGMLGVGRGIYFDEKSSKRNRASKYPFKLNATALHYLHGAHE